MEAKARGLELYQGVPARRAQAAFPETRAEEKWLGLKPLLPYGRQHGRHQLSWLSYHVLSLSERHTLRTNGQ